MPPARMSSTARPIWRASWVRCIQRSTPGSNDCAPSETRFTPRRAPGLDRGRGDVVRVGLERDFGTAFHAAVAPDLLDDPGQGPGSEA